MLVRGYDGGESMLHEAHKRGGAGHGYPPANSRGLALPARRRTAQITLRVSVYRYCGFFSDVANVLPQVMDQFLSVSLVAASRISY